MEKVANLLRQAREQRTMSIEEAAQRSRIPLPYLALLEDSPLEKAGRTRPLPDPFYLVPYVRKYAAFLGLDPNLMTTQFTNTLQEAPEKRAKVTPTGTPTQILAATPRRSRAISLSIVLASVLITLAFIGQYSDMNARAPGVGESRPLVPIDLSSPPSTSSVPTPRTPEPPLASAKEPRSDMVAAPLVAPAKESPVAPPLTPSENIPALHSDAKAPSLPSSGQPPVSSAAYVLRARASEATWIRVLVDGQTPRELILRPGQSAEWTSDSAFQVTLGNAGGVTLNLNGQDLSPLGKSGQVIRNMRLPAPQSGGQG
jgi:cytoskeletal protein RodZ